MGKKILVTYDGSPSYHIYIERDFSALFSALRELPGLFDLSGGHLGRKLCIVTDGNVGPLYLKEVKLSLEPVFSMVSSFTFPAGEEHKNTDTTGLLYEHLIQDKFDRKDLLLALGGGVVGDLCGFVAATYLRGIEFIQVPTSLLAQVDSSIGGKTGVDFMQYKNMVGAFHMPKLVYINLATLHTLSERQFLSGMAEVIKHGFIKDRTYLEFLEGNRKKIRAKDLEIMKEVVYRSCEIKRDVVERDPKEQGERALLNFGHTLGHAIEKLSEFSYTHGEAVALGMVGAGYLSDVIAESCHLRVAGLPKGGAIPSESKAYRGIETLLKSYHLPTRLSPDVAFTSSDILEATKSDKKMDGEQIRFILLKEPGEAYITREVTDKQMLEAIKYLYNPSLHTG